MLPRTPEPAIARSPAPPRTAQRIELSVPSPAPTPAPAWSDPAAAALASGAATLAADGSVVFKTPASIYPRESASTQTAQRQRDTMPAPASDPGAPTQAAPATVATSAHDHGDVEELAKRVYDRISERLKSELRLDRERSGRLTDLSR